MSVFKCGKTFRTSSQLHHHAMLTLERGLSWTLVPLASQHFLPPFHGNYCPAFFGKPLSPQQLMWYIGGALFLTARVELGV